MNRPLATARWETDQEYIYEQFGYKEGAVWLGRTIDREARPIGLADDRHVLLTGLTREGKGTTCAVNTMLLWPGSFVMIGPKGENATIAAARRGPGSEHCKGLGQKVYVLDPYHEAQVDDALRSRFNPFDALDPNDKYCVRKAKSLAAGLIIVPHDVKEPFFYRAAQRLVTGVILHVLTHPKYEGRRTLVTVRQLLSEGDIEVSEAQEAAAKPSWSQTPFKREITITSEDHLWEEMIANKALNGEISRSGHRARTQSNQAPKMWQGIQTTAIESLDFLDNADIRDILSASDFKLSDLKTDPNGVSLFICLPTRHMEFDFIWLRLMINLITAEIEAIPGLPKSGHPILMMLDEFAGLDRMKKIETSMAQLAGAGLKLFLIAQDYGQLEVIYKSGWQSLFNNCGVRILYGTDDAFTRNYASEYAGKTEIIKEARSSSLAEGQNRGETSSLGTGGSDSQNRSTNTGRSKQMGFLSVFWAKGKTRQSGRSEGLSTGKNWRQSTSTSEGYTTTQTKGIAESFHVEPLLEPHVLGTRFGRITDKNNPAYPGVACVLISGQSPIVLRRSSYYDDPFFVQKFDPHPDHGWVPMIVPVETRPLISPPPIPVAPPKNVIRVYAPPKKVSHFLRSNGMWKEPAWKKPALKLFDGYGTIYRYGYTTPLSGREVLMDIEPNGDLSSVRDPGYKTLIFDLCKKIFIKRVLLTIPPVVVFLSLVISTIGLFMAENGVVCLTVPALVMLLAWITSVGVDFYWEDLIYPKRALSSMELVTLERNTSSEPSKRPENQIKPIINPDEIIISPVKGSLQVALSVGQSFKEGDTLFIVAPRYSVTATGSGQIAKFLVEGGAIIEIGQPILEVYTGRLKQLSAHT